MTYMSTTSNVLVSGDQGAVKRKIHNKCLNDLHETVLLIQQSQYRLIHQFASNMLNSIRGAQFYGIYKYIATDTGKQ